MTSTAHTQSHLERRIRERRRDQLRRFGELRTEFAATHASVACLDGDGLVEREWRERNRALAADVLPAPPDDFLRHPAILYSMFMPPRSIRHELPLLTDAHGDRELGALLEEDPVGSPPLVPGHDGSYATSSNRIHHAYHLERHTAATRVDLAQLGTVVEWGGGYGNLARLVRRRAPRCTYVVIDTPLFSCLQWLYLASVLGPGGVRLVRSRGQPIAAGCVNLVPVGLAGELTVQADLFVSTWALNESSRRAQELVLERAWFGARHLLLGMHDTDPFAGLAVRAGARRVPVGDFLPAQSYFVA